MGGIPGLGPCRTPGPGGLITGAPGDPSRGSARESDGAPFPVVSLDSSSLGMPLAADTAAAAGINPGKQEQKHPHAQSRTIMVGSS